MCMWRLSNTCNNMHDVLPHYYCAHVTAELKNDSQLAAK